MPKTAQIKSKTPVLCLEVALAVPVRRCFSYHFTGKTPDIGTRVIVPFARRKMLGVVVAHQRQLPQGFKLKPIIKALESTPIFCAHLIDLIRWSANYYHHPLGEVWHTAMPVVLRKGMDEKHGLQQTIYSVNKPLPTNWAKSLKRAPLQTKTIECLIQHQTSMSHDALISQIPNAHSAITALLKKGLVQSEKSIPSLPVIKALGKPNTLSPEQASVSKNLLKTLGSFSCTALQGVTGSGKTEVYFSVIDKIITQGKQALVMLPEIALTDQHFDRFFNRFGSHVAQVHSGMSDAARYRIWRQASKGEISIILGTRSSVFMQFDDLGLIIIDEEHDLSYKQQEGFRYHARSVAIKRGQLASFPVLLGSATLSLETKHNVQIGRYQQLNLRTRAGLGEMPTVDIIDLNHQPAQDGFSASVIEALSNTLKQKQQALVFINRRGFAPVLFCQSCQWTATCKRCDAQMTTHQNHAQSINLQCHHCGARRAAPTRCDDCHAPNLVCLGEGTQKIEASLNAMFPDASIQRFDKDELSTASKMHAAMAAVHAGEIDILVGTQLLSKGHDFAAVNLVLVINADQGLYSADFRATEQMVQQLVQVAGRAGRGTEKGRVLIQTHFPQHPALLAVKTHDFARFSSQELNLRKQAQFPPYAHIALWRTRGRDANQMMACLRQIYGWGKQSQPSNTLCFDPIKSPMFKRNGQYHGQLLISADKRPALHAWLRHWLSLLEKDKRIKKIKWSIDVDPLSLF